MPEHSSLAEQMAAQDADRRQKIGHIDGGIKSGKDALAAHDVQEHERRQTALDHAGRVAEAGRQALGEYKNKLGDNVTQLANLNPNEKPGPRSVEDAVNLRSKRLELLYDGSAYVSHLAQDEKTLRQAITTSDKIKNAQLLHASLEAEGNPDLLSDFDVDAFYRLSQTVVAARVKNLSHGYHPATELTHTIKELNAFLRDQRLSIHAIEKLQEIVDSELQPKITDQLHGDVQAQAQRGLMELRTAIRKSQPEKAPRSAPAARSDAALTI